ncbi:hypothetical protein M0R45_021390 [Rubus argutus]|uniref:Uncharacterized protein n=1 Tax=Rubus argutus TaxID=59490 RepID=A0AAW1XB74_RUBAR
MPLSASSCPYFFLISLQHFVHEENMWEVDCPCLTPEAVLKASGHVDKFSDLMVKDDKTGTCYRADHLLKDFCNKKLEEGRISSEMAMELKQLLSKLDALSAEELLLAYLIKWTLQVPPLGNVTRVLMSSVYPLQSPLILHPR